MGLIIAIIYGAIAYWAAGKTVYANKIRIGTHYGLFSQRFIVGFLFGIILIPVAILRVIFRI
ncbi:MAG: cystinosin-like protein [Lachnospirales bacterium]